MALANSQVARPLFPMCSHGLQIVPARPGRLGVVPPGRAPGCGLPDDEAGILPAARI